MKKGKIKEFFKAFFDVTFLKYMLVGVANTLIGMGVMFLFYNVFHLDYWISTAANIVFGSISSYILNRFFTFKNRMNTGKTIWKFILNIALCYLIAYGVARPIVRAILTGAGQSLQDNISMLVGQGTFVLLNYVGQRFFVFKKSEENEGQK